MTAKNPSPKPFPLSTPRIIPVSKSREELAIHEESGPEDPSAWHKEGSAALINASYTPGEGKRAIVSRIPLIRDMKMGSEDEDEDERVSSNARNGGTQGKYLSHSSSKRPGLQLQGPQPAE